MLTVKGIVPWPIAFVKPIIAFVFALSYKVADIRGESAERFSVEWPGLGSIFMFLRSWVRFRHFLYLFDITR